MKIAILGDVHFGARNRNLTIENWQRKFYEEFFWPEIDRLGIDTIFQTGDYFDSRKWINIQTMAFQKEVFVKPAQERKCDVRVIVGNHDIPLRNSLKNSSVKQILDDEKGFTVYDHIVTEEFDGTEVSFFPWICKENQEASFEFLSMGGDVAFGHFEIDGFMMHPGAFARSDSKSVDFKNWNKVIAGHFHAQSQKENIHYVGTPYQMSWSDWSTKHGFWIFDTFDKSMTFHENPFRFFHKIVWDNGTNYELSSIKESYVKIEVKEKNDFEQFEKFIDRVNFSEPYEFKIIESFEEFNSENVTDVIEMASTTELIEQYISDVATVHNKDNIVKTMLDIYNEALEISDSL